MRKSNEAVIKSFYKNTDLVSIIVTVYNVEKYLKKCLTSIIEQTFHSIEIILIDDGSTDSSGGICDQYTINDSRIRTIHQKNLGVSAARKAGLEIAKGEYVYFVDSDDYLDLDCIEAMYYQIKKVNVDFMHFGYKQKNINGGSISLHTFPDIVFKFITNDDKKHFLRRYVLDIKSPDLLAYSVWSKLFKRDFIKAVYRNVPNYIKIGEDAICFVYAIKKCSSFAVVSIAKYNYIIRGDSASHLMDLQYRINVCHFAHEMLLACDVCGYDSLSDTIIQYFRYLFYHADRSAGLPLKEYFFPDKSVLKNKRIYIYGAGAVGKDFYDDFTHDTGINLLGLVDQDWKKFKFSDAIVHAVDKLQSADFDYVVVAIYNPVVAESIIHNLCQMGLARQKIIYQKPRRIFDL